MSYLQDVNDKLDEDEPLDEQEHSGIVDITAEELKTKGEAEAKQIDDVTVLFTDFKGFTQLSENLSPKELVADIHECFSVFDHIMQKHGIEKNHLIQSHLLHPYFLSQK